MGSTIGDPAVPPELELTPDQLRPDDRRRAVVELLAAGLRRLRDLSARTATVFPSVFQPDSDTSPLEPVPANPLTDPAS